MNEKEFAPNHHELDPFAESRDHSNAWDTSALPRSRKHKSKKEGRLDPAAERRDHSNAWDVSALAKKKSK